MLFERLSTYPLIFQNASFYVIPAHAGIYSSKRAVPDVGWFPAFAGMTIKTMLFERSRVYNEFKLKFEQKYLNFRCEKGESPQGPK